jgi:hypothetical protein
MSRRGSRDVQNLEEDAVIPRSLVACVDGRERSLCRTGLVSNLVKPVVIDPFHIMLGAGSDDWGTCLYLTITDAALIHAELGRILADHSVRG